MKDKTFIDTNILIYLYSTSESDKREKMLNHIRQNSCVISSQVANEFINIVNKHKASLLFAQDKIREIESVFTIYSISLKTTKLALDLKEVYNYSYYDSLIISSALENGCTILLTEDMHNGHIINEQLTIVNPFNGNQ